MQFFTSNLFFDNIKVSEDRHFKSVSDMNSLILKNWNSLVVDTDKVYILGNIGNFDYLRELNGIKVLFLSENDLDFFNKYVSSVSSERDDYYDKEMFELYCQSQYQVDHITFSKKAVVSTFTNNLLRLTVESVNGKDTVLNIYGGLGSFKKLEKNTLNVDILVNGYFPVSEVYIDSVIKYMKQYK